MRIHRLTVRNFRGIVDRTVDLPDTGTTVIVGDNEVGKSTLVEAMLVLFDLADDSKAARVRVVQPVGADLGPEAAVELTLGEYRIAYAKRWLRDRSTELTVTAPSGSVRSYTGREAHDEAGRLFRRHVDPVLWQTLLVGQGQSLVQPAPADAEPLIAAVNAESGTSADGGSIPLVAAIEQEYLRYWTKTGRQTGDFARAADLLAAARQSADETDRAMAAVADDIRRAERLDQVLVDLRRRHDAQASVVDDLQRRARLAEALRGRRDAVLQRADTMRARLENRTAARVARDRLVAEVEHRTACVAALRARIAQSEPAIATNAAALRACQAASAAAAEVRDGWRAAVREAERRLARAADRTELTRLTERHAEVVAVRERIAAARTVLASIQVTDELATALEEAHDAVVLAEAALDAAAPQVVVRRLGGAAAVQVSDDHTLFGTELVGVDQVSQRVSGELRVVVPEQLEVTVRAGGEVVGLRQAVEEAARRERALLGQAGAKDLRAVRTLVRRRDAAAVELAEAQRTEASLVADGDPAQRIAVLTARLSVEGAQPDEEPPGADAAADPAVDAATLEHRRSELAVAELASTEAELAEARVRESVDDDRAAAVRSTAQLDVELDRLEAAEQAVGQARATSPDDDLLSAETDAQAAVRTVLDELAALQREVEDQGADELPALLTDARRVLDQLDTERDELRDELRLTEGRLQQSGTDGLATRSDAAQVALERSDTAFAVLRRRAEAARRVRETLARHRTEAQQRYAAPLRSRIETLGRSVYGPTFRVALSDDLAVSERELDGVRLPVDALSTGAREQLAIITRLAISQLVGTGAGHVPAILDDALGWSDKGRLRAMGALLGRAGEQGQVIVLTCVPERYAAVPGRHVIRLTA